MLFRGMADLGFTDIICTPHIIADTHPNNPETIQNAAQFLKSEAQKLGVNLDFRIAAEYMLDTSFSELLQKEKLLTLKENYVLVEMSYLNPPMQLVDLIYEIQLAGYIPVLAHPERYLFYHNNTSEYEKLKNAGCLFQLNLLSTVEYYGSKIAKTADELLKKGMYKIVVNFSFFRELV